MYGINSEGSILYRSEDVNNAEKDRLLDRVTALSLNIRVYVSAMEDAEPLKAQVLKEGYKYLRSTMMLYWQGLNCHRGNVNLMTKR